MREGERKSRLNTWQSARHFLVPFLWLVGACTPGDGGPPGTGGFAVTGGFGGGATSGGTGATPGGEAGGTAGFPGANGGASGGAESGNGGASGGVPGGGASGGLGPIGTGGEGDAGGSGGSGDGGEIGSGGTFSGGGSGGAGGSTGGSGGEEDDLCDAGVFGGTPPVPLQLSGQTFAHDPTMLKVNGTYYRFWTGDFIPTATSSNLTDWQGGAPVYGASYPSWSTDWLASVPGDDFNFPWAPDVSEFGDQVHLYSSFSARFGDNISCITHLTTSDISAGDWVDHGPVICTTGDERYNAIDADVGRDEAGQPWLAFGSFWDGIMAFSLNEDGSRKGQELIGLARAPELEAPVLLRRCGWHYLFVTFGLCCPGEGRSVDDLTYRVVVGRSRAITGPYVDRQGTPMLEGGGTLMTEGDGVTWAAAGHSDVLVDGENIYHLYHAYRQDNGTPSLRVTPLLFDPEGWPVPHAP